jgi:hypothetical protein
MNKFEKYCWNKCVKDSLFGARFSLRQEIIKLVKHIPIIWKFLKIKKQHRVQEFIGFYK